MDLIKKNRWKDLETLGTNKPVWIFISIIYLFMDGLFFLIAIVQTNKLLKFYK